MNTIRKIAVSMLFLLSCIGMSDCGKSKDESAVPEVDTVQSEVTNTQDTDAGMPSEAVTEITSETEPNEDVQPSDKEQPSSGSEVIVVFFSATGTTKGVAEKIAAVENADLYEIIPSEPYSNADLNWNDSNSRTTKEQNDPSIRPEIASERIELDEYARIFIGYPIWWGEEPRIMDTFVESYDFDNAEVIPFCTSGGSGMGGSGMNIGALAKDAHVIEGKRFAAGVSEDELKKWASTWI